MYQYELPKYFPTADELPCSDDTPVDNELQELIPSLAKLEIYKLVNGDTLSLSKGNYQLQIASPLWMPEIGLGIGSERASYDGSIGEWLYWYDENSQRYPTPYERADRLAAQLRALGIEPEVP